MADTAMTDTPDPRRRKPGDPAARRASKASPEVDDIFCRGNARCGETPRRYDEELENAQVVQSTGSTLKTPI